MKLHQGTRKGHPSAHWHGSDDDDWSIFDKLLVFLALCILCIILSLALTWALTPDDKPPLATETSEGKGRVGRLEFDRRGNFLELVNGMAIEQERRPHYVRRVRTWVLNSSGRTLSRTIRGKFSGDVLVEENFDTQESFMTGIEGSTNSSESPVQTKARASDDGYEGDDESQLLLCTVDNAQSQAKYNTFSEELHASSKAYLSKAEQSL